MLIIKFNTLNLVTKILRTRVDSIYGNYCAVFSLAQVKFKNSGGCPS